MFYFDLSLILSEPGPAFDISLYYVYIPTRPVHNKGTGPLLQNVWRVKSFQLMDGDQWNTHTQNQIEQPNNLDSRNEKRMRPSI
jgi:hypothetical protein